MGRSGYYPLFKRCGSLFLCCNMAIFRIGLHTVFKSMIAILELLKYFCRSLLPLLFFNRFRVIKPFERSFVPAHHIKAVFQKKPQLLKG